MSFIWNWAAFWTADFLGRKKFYWAIFWSSGPEFGHLAAVVCVWCVSCCRACMTSYHVAVQYSVLTSLLSPPIGEAEG